MNQSASDAVSRLERASSWRKKELQSMHSALLAFDMSVRHSMMRGSLVLTCAHCEGFLRDATRLFMHHLERESPPVENLRESYFITLKPDGLTRSWSKARQRLLQDRAGIRILAELRQHLWLLGLDYSPFEAQAKPLGELMRLRNKIAHGENTSLSGSNYEEHTRRALDFIDTLQEEIVGSIRYRRYLRSAA